MHGVPLHGLPAFAVVVAIVNAGVCLAARTERIVVTEEKVTFRVIPTRAQENTSASRAVIASTSIVSSARRPGVALLDRYEYRRLTSRQEVD
jgi:hypothetical protein